MYKINDHIRRNLPAILLVTLLLILPSCRYIRQRLPFGKYSLKSAVEWAIQDSTRVADSLKRVMSDKKIFERTLTDSLMSIEEKNLTEGDTAPYYYIITGSFSNHDNAVQTAGKYTSQGFKTAIITKSGNNGERLELVSVKTFMDRSEADIFLKDFQTKYNPDAWTFTGKP